MAEGEAERIALRRAIAVIRADSITVRPSRGQLLAPLVQLAIAAGAIALIVLLLDRLPLAVLALLLLVAVLLGPIAALGFVFGLFGSSMVVDGRKQSAHWQQGFLGLGIGTTESMPFARIDHVAVTGDYDDELTDGGLPDVVTWDVELVRDDGKRSAVGSVLTARPLANEALARANDVAAAIGALTGAEVRAAALPAELLAADPAAADAGTEGARPRRRRRGGRARPARGTPAAAERGRPEIVDDERAWELLRDARRIAVVARSPRTTRPWHGVTGYLIAAGYEVQIVNPLLDEAHGLRCYESVQELPTPVDIVDVFRRIPEVPAVVEDAIAAGAPTLWLQLEIVHEAAIARASEAGLQVVVDRCTAIEHRRHSPGLACASAP